MRKDKAYMRHLTTNTHSVRSSLVKLHAQGEDWDQCKLLGTVVHTKYKGHEQVLDLTISDLW